MASQAFRVPLAEPPGGFVACSTCCDRGTPWLSAGLTVWAATRGRDGHHSGVHAAGRCRQTVINGLIFDGATKDPMRKPSERVIAFMAATAQAASEARRSATGRIEPRKGEPRGEQVSGQEAELLREQSRPVRDHALAGTVSGPVANHGGPSRADGLTVSGMMRRAQSCRWRNGGCEPPSFRSFRRKARRCARSERNLPARAIPTPERVDCDGR